MKIANTSEPMENFDYNHVSQLCNKTQCTCNVTLRCVRATIVAVKEQYVIHILSVCFVALGAQQAMCMRHIFVCGLAGSTIFFHIIP